MAKIVELEGKVEAVEQATGLIEGEVQLLKNDIITLKNGEYVLDVETTQKEKDEVKKKISNTMLLSVTATKI